MLNFKQKTKHILVRFSRNNEIDMKVQNAFGFHEDWKTLNTDEIMKLQDSIDKIFLNKKCTNEIERLENYIKQAQRQKEAVFVRLHFIDAAIRHQLENIIEMQIELYKKQLQQYINNFTVIESKL